MAALPIYYSPASVTYCFTPSSKSSASPATFHQSLPSFEQTPLRRLEPLAATKTPVYIKDESSRLGLPAFKILGASWAIYSCLVEKLGVEKDVGFDILKQRLIDDGRQWKIYTATDGNHGRAVARMAKLLGLPACIVIPFDVTSHSRDLIASEGAEVVQIKEDYDAAVVSAARAAENDPQGLLIQDTSWEGYTEIPEIIIEGYTTLFSELDEQLRAVGISGPSVVVVPVGVGSLAHAAVAHYRSSAYRYCDENPPVIITVEPTTASCLLQSLHNGTLTTVPTSSTIMPGLNCATPSLLSFPLLKAGVTFAVGVEDGRAEAAMRDLWKDGVEMGPCGAATLAGLLKVLTDDKAGKQLHLEEMKGCIVLIGTEGSEIFKAAQGQQQL